MTGTACSAAGTDEVIGATTGATGGAIEATIEATGVTTEETGVTIGMIGAEAQAGMARADQIVGKTSEPQEPLRHGVRRDGSWVVVCSI